MEPESPDKLDTLLESIKKHKKEINTPLMRALGLWIMYTSLYSCAFLYCLIFLHYRMNIMQRLSIVTLGLLFWGPLDHFWSVKRRTASKAYKQEIVELTAYEDVRAVPYLLDELWSGDIKIRGPVHAALIRILPQIQTDNAPTLNAKQRDKLYRLPSTEESIPIEFRLAALEAMAQIGDKQAIRFCDYVPSTFPKGSGDDTLFQAAKRSLTLLTERLAAEQSGAVLLRASHAPADKSDTLLRPASAGDTTAPQMLLRAAHDSNHDDTD